MEKKVGSGKVDVVIEKLKEFKGSAKIKVSDERLHKIREKEARKYNKMGGD